MCLTSYFALWLKTKVISETVRRNDDITFHRLQVTGMCMAKEYERRRGHENFPPMSGTLAVIFTNLSFSYKYYSSIRNRKHARTHTHTNTNLDACIHNIQRIS